MVRKTTHMLRISDRVLIIRAHVFSIRARVTNPSNREKLYSCVPGILP